MSALVNKQADFLFQLAHLITWINTANWNSDRVQFTAGDFYAQSGHMAGSLHYSRLAADLNLFVNGVYITGDHPYWHKIGEAWKSLHPDNRWGGDFRIKDYNHFSRKHNGKA